MDGRPTGNRNISTWHVSGKAGKRFFAPMKSAAVYVGLNEPLECHATLSLPGLKKAVRLPALSETLWVPDANDGNAIVLELDELWSFVLKKTNQAWIWIALCRKM